MRRIFHVDVNSAYLSWEAVRRIAEGGEDIRLIASASGGAQDRRTSVILSKSVPAKKSGVRTGEPVAMALRKCPQLRVFPPDFRLYEQNSRAFVKICREYTPVVEKFSIDECFLDMTGIRRAREDAVGLAGEIGGRIRNELGFTVNVGIGPNKLLAKTASDFEKPDRVHTLFFEELAEKFWPLPVRELYSVGGSTADRLEGAGIRTIGELAGTDARYLAGLFGEKRGAQLLRFANGEDDSPVPAEPEPAKGYSISTTFDEDVVSAEQAREILHLLASDVTARMRMDRAKAFCVSVVIRSNAFRNRSHQRRLREASDITAEICAAAKQLFSELWDGRTPMRLLGVALTDIVYGEETQLTMLPDEGREKARRFDRAVDAIRNKFGSDAIRSGSALGSSLRAGRKYRAQMEIDRRDGDRPDGK